MPEVQCTLSKLQFLFQNCISKRFFSCHLEVQILFVFKLLPCNQNNKDISIENKIFANYASSKGLSFKMYKKLFLFWQYWGLNLGTFPTSFLPLFFLSLPTPTSPDLLLLSFVPLSVSFQTVSCSFTQIRLNLAILLPQPLSVRE